MRDLRGPVAGLVTVATLWAFAGCGGGAPAVDSSDTEATVKGVVKLGGKPAAEGDIVFSPVNYKRPNAAPRTAAIGKDGSYTIKTLTGENEVRLSGAITKKSPVAAYKREVINVQTGENAFDFEVGGEGKGATASTK